VAAVLNITPETTARVLVELRLTEEQAALAKSEAIARTNAERVNELCRSSPSDVIRMELKCIRCDPVDPLNTELAKWADSPLAPPK
jgi:hypothetical protein